MINALETENARLRAELKRTTADLAAATVLLDDITHALSEIARHDVRLLLPLRPLLRRASQHAKSRLARSRAAGPELLAEHELRRGALLTSAEIAAAAEGNA